MMTILLVFLTCPGDQRVDYARRMWAGTLCKTVGSVDGQNSPPGCRLHGLQLRTLVSEPL